MHSIKKIYIWLTIIFLISPCLIIIPLSFTTSRFINFPPSQYGILWYEQFFTSTQWLKALMNSVIVGIVTSLLSTSLAVVSSYFLLKSHQGRLTSSWQALLLAPAIVPVVTLSLGMYMLLGSGTILNLIIGHFLIVFPVCFLIFKSAFNEFDFNIEYSSWTLGLSKISTFFSIILPSIKNSIIISLLFGFFLSFDELVLALYLTDAYTPTIPKLMWASIKQEFDLTSSVIATLIFLIQIITFIIVIVKKGKDDDINRGRQYC